MVNFDKQYWLSHAASYRNEADFEAPTYKAQEAALVEVLDTLEFNSVMEIGAGFGRITNLVVPYISNPSENYMATDVSSEFLSQIGLDVGKEILDLDHLPNPLPLYDLVIAVEVLMHRPFEKARDDLFYMLGMSKRYVLLIDWYEPDFKGEAPGCYQHQWADYTDLPIKARLAIPQARQALYLFEQKPEVQVEEVNGKKETVTA